MVDQNSGAVKMVSLSDIFSSSGALQFKKELDDPGVFIPARTLGRGRGGLRGEYVVVHGEANKGKRRFDDDLSADGPMTKGADTSRFRRDVRTTKEFLARCQTKKKMTKNSSYSRSGIVRAR